MASDTFRKQYRQLTDAEAADVEALKVAAEQIEAILSRRSNRYSALAMTSLEQTVMWGVKGISG